MRIEASSADFDVHAKKAVVSIVDADGAICDLPWAYFHLPRSIP